jgi:membrane peptidoglycan carboxypeptidase
VTLLKLFAVLICTGLLGAAVLVPYIGGLGLVGNSQSEKFLNATCNLKESAVPQKTTIYASDGKTALASIFQYDRQVVSIKVVPQSLQDALIATEDRRFYSHHGVDMRGLVRSALSTSNGDTQGGSTLTMQYVKQERYYQAYNNPAAQQAAIAQNLNRKIEDAKCALDIETRESKPTILQNYLNIAFFGENSYGIETAAETYFSKPVNKLDIAQSAMLVGLLQAPSEYDPFGNNGQNYNAALKRRNQVLQNLVDVGKLSPADAKKWEAKGLELGSTKPPNLQQGCAATEAATAVVKNAGFFCDYLVNDWLPNVGKLTTQQINEGGLKIVSTLNVTAQNAAQQKLGVVNASSPSTAVMPELDPKTGRILAFATSKKYGLPLNAKDTSRTTVPVFTQDTTGAASTFKLFPMLAALSVGAPTSLEFGSDDKQGNGDFTYVPSACGGTTTAFHNSGDNVQFTRNENMSSAIARSSNTYFLALEDQFFSDCDMAPYVNMALSLGMDSLNDKNSAGADAQTAAQLIVAEQRPTFTLGQDPTDPLEVAAAYAAVANNGKYCAPVPVISITDASGNPVKVAGLNNCKQVLAPQVALTAQQLLLGDTTSTPANGPGTSASVFQQWYSTNASPVSGKTGTNNASDSHGNQLPTNSSVWFAGITPHLAAVTAVMNIDHPSAPLSGLPNINGAPGSQMTTAQAGAQMGPYAAALWLRAATPLLRLQGGGAWNWPTNVQQVQAGGENVPNVVGQAPAAASATLTAAGFKVHEVENGQPYCASATAVPGTVAYQSPTWADPGATITFCAASYTQPQIYTPPPPRPPPVTTRPTNTPTTAGSTPPQGGATPPATRPSTAPAQIQPVPRGR